MTSSTKTKPLLKTSSSMLKPFDGLPHSTSSNYFFFSVDSVAVAQSLSPSPNHFAVSDGQDAYGLLCCVRNRYHLVGSDGTRVPQQSAAAERAGSSSARDIGPSRRLLPSTGRTARPLCRRLTRNPTLKESAAPAPSPENKTPAATVIWAHYAYCLLACCSVVA